MCWPSGELPDGLAGFDGPSQGMLIGIFDVHAHGNAARQATRPHRPLLQAFGKVGGGRLSGDGRTGGNQHFVHSPRIDAGEEFADLLFLRTDAVHG